MAGRQRPPVSLGDVSCYISTLKCDPTLTKKSRPPVQDAAGLLEVSDVSLTEVGTKCSGLGGAPWLVCRLQGPAARRSPCCDSALMLDSVGY